MNKGKTPVPNPTPNINRPQQVPPNPLQSLFQNPEQLNAMMQTASQLFQGLQDSSGNDGEIDLSKMVDQTMGMFGGNMDENTKAAVKDKTMAMMNQFQVEGRRVEPSTHNQNQPRIQSNFQEQEIPKADQWVPKVPVQQKNYEELDQDSEVDVFCPRTKDLEISINVSLEEFYSGHQKKLGIKRKRIVKVDKAEKVVEETKKIMIPILPGMRDEQVIRYNKQGDEMPGYETGDIVINLRQNGHPYFERGSDDLFIVKNISLYESYAAAAGMISLTVRTLDNRYLILNTNGSLLHVNEGLRKVVGEGMPRYRDQAKSRGDLYIRFNLILPESIKDIRVLKELFPPVNEDIIYNDGTKNTFEVGRKSQVSDLEPITEEDLAKINYRSDDDDESDDDDDDDDDESEESDRSKSESEESGGDKERRRDDRRDDRRGDDRRGDDRKGRERRDERR
jgi:DnaJ-class molecular chaperone